MSPQRLLEIQRTVDACAELLYVAGEKRAAQKLATTPPEAIARSRASERRRKTPLLQPAFESDARRRARGYVADLERFSRTTAARRIDERVARERGA